MGLRERFSGNETFRRGAIGAVAGAVAGLTAASLNTGGTIERFLVAIFIGGVLYVALWLLTS